MSGPKGYSTYHGRSPLWRALVMVVLVLVILAAGSFVFLQRYLVYDDNGQARLELPWDQETPPSTAAQKPQDTQDPASSSEEDLVIQEPEVTLPAVSRAVLLGEDPGLWSAAVSGLSAAQQNAYAVTVKAPGGRIQFASQAAHPNAIAPSAAAVSALLPTLLADQETHAIARLSCFRDAYAAEADLDGAGLKNTGGYIFWDGENQRWLDPAKPAARKYLCDIAAECAALGFDEILLTDFTYPTVGKLNKIAYGTDVDKTQQLLLLLTELRTALEPYEVSLSVELPVELFATGTDEASGLRLTDIAQQADAVYVETTQEAYEDLTAKLPEGARLVAELRAVPAAEDVPYLLLP